MTDSFHYPASLNIYYSVLFFAVPILKTSQGSGNSNYYYYSTSPGSHSISAQQPSQALMSVIFLVEFNCGFLERAFRVRILPWGCRRGSDGSSSLATGLDLEAPWKHSSGCVCDCVSRRID